MKLKLKALVAAVALVAAGSANAAVTGGQAATGSSLMFEAWDTVSGLGMVQSLGETYASALTMSTLNFNLDSATFSSLLGTDTAGTGLNWKVFSVMHNDYGGASAPNSLGGYGLLTTVSKLPGLGFREDSSQLASLLLSQGDTAGTGHLGDINAALGTPTYGIIPNGNVANAGPSGGGGGAGNAYYGNFIGGDGGRVGFGSLDFYKYANDPDTYALLENKLGGTGAQFTLASTGNVSFGAPAAVPLPAAAWLFGSGLLGQGGIGRRRKQA